MKLLIVEDEKLCREVLAEIEWQSIGIEVIGQADGANSALKIARTTPPDIVLTDIAMEDGDGFYLAKELSLLTPGCKIIFLTAHDKFEYAHKAISFKPFAFLLKPVNTKAIIETVKEAKEELLKANNEKKRYQKMLNNFSECQYFLSEYFLSLAKKQPQQLGNFFKIGNETSKYQALVVTLQDTTIEKIDFQLFWNLDTLLQQSGYQNNISFYENDKLIFIFYYEESDSNDSFDDIYVAATLIEKHLTSTSETLSYTISIGSVAESKEEIPYSLQRALDAQKYRFSMGENQILYIDDLEPLNNNIPNLNDIKNDIVNSIKVENSSEATRLISQLFITLRRNNISSDFAKRICFELIVSYSIAMGQLGYNPEVVFKQTNIWSVLNQCHSLQELKEMLLGITHSTCSMIASIREAKSNDIIDLVVETIEKSDNKDISLQTMASQVHISACYLSSMFRKKTGVTYKNFIVQAKINKAKELLAHSETPIYKIATLIGYKSPQHFSTVFKEHTGLLPTEYRNNNRIGN